MATPGAKVDRESMSEGSLFEALFERVLKPTGAFADELRRIGYDPAKTLAKYPTRVWLEAVEIACRFAFPGLARPQAMRRVGRTVVEGFLGTLVGKVIGVGIPLIGPERAIMRLPTYISAGRKDLEIEVTMEAKRRARVVVVDAFAVPEFMAGVIEAGMEKAGVTAKVEIVEVALPRYQLGVSWS